MKKAISIGISFISVFCLSIIFNSDFSSTSSREKLPIILVPGDGGCQAFCYPRTEKADPFLLWINLWYFLRLSSFDEYFSLVYNRTTHTVHDKPYCNIRFPGYGDTRTISNLDTSAHSGTVYFSELIEQLRKDSWYVSNVTMRGVPYDFRKAPLEDPSFNQNLTALIEETYQLAGNRRVVLLGHSLGAIYSLAFLASVSDEWKRKYIDTFMSVSGPYGGSIKAMRIEASGENFHVFVRSPLAFRPIQRSMQSLAYLMPRPRLWNSSVTLIRTPEKNYSTGNMHEFFKDIGFENGYFMMRDTIDRLDTFKEPTGVDNLYCIHGAKLPTAHQLIYLPPSWWRDRGAFPDQAPEEVNADGDQTVTWQSLRVCANWSKAKKLNKHIVLDGAEHLKIIGDQRLIDIVREVIGSTTNSLS